MEPNPPHQNHSVCSEGISGVAPPQAPPTSTPDSNTSSSTTPTTPIPPRLTPNPLLLDSPVSASTPTTSSPPPPLTPAPSVSSSHGPKSAGTVTSPHILVPAPPKLTPTATPTLRTYSRPILPSPSVSKTPPSAHSSAATAAHAITASASPLVSSSSAPSTTQTSAAVSTSSKTSTSLTNGITRPVSTPTSTQITPFHTPASPPGRQAPQSHPAGSPGLVRANQSSPPVRQRVSQQTLLLGKGLKGSGQDQVLLRAQMLQSLSLRPPPPPPPPLAPPSSTALTLPPTLRLKPSSSSAPPPPLSRPNAPLFPPLRPRPQPNTTVTESPTTPIRHLSVPPPTLYSPVRAVPLRPRLHSPNGHRASSPCQTLTFQPITAPPSSQATSNNRPLTGLKNGTSTSNVSSSAQPLKNPSAPLHFDRPPSAARQLQIIALSSGRQQQPGTFGQSTLQSSPPPPPPPPPMVTGLSELSRLSKRTLSSDDTIPLPLKTTPLLSSPPSLKSPASPPTHRGPKESLEFGGRGAGLVIKEEAGVSKDLRLVKNDQKEKEVEQKEWTATKKEQEVEPISKEEKEEKMEAMEKGQDKQEDSKVKKKIVEDKEEKEKEQAHSAINLPVKLTTNQLLHQNQNPDPILRSDTVKDSTTELKPSLGPFTSSLSQQTSVPVQAPIPVQISIPVQIPVPVPVPVQIPVPVTVPVQLPVPMQSPVPVQNSHPVQIPVPAAPPVSDVSVQGQRLQESQRELVSVSQEDFCENMSIQSAESAVSSLSSQSPPVSPVVVTPSAEKLPPLLPVQQPENDDDAVVGSASQLEQQQQQSQQLSDARPKLLLFNQSEEEAEGVNQSLSSPWEPREWPEGREVLTHLVEGFVIQEGLAPFPVNRSSLLLPEQVPPTQEVNGADGGAAEVTESSSSSLPVTEKRKAQEHSTDSEEEDGGDADNVKSRSTHRERTVLHCQFCGKRGHAHNFMRSKRFCSTSCARGFNVRLTKRLRALSAGGRSERPRPALNRAESVPGKPLLLRLPRDLWSAGRREKEEKEKEAMAVEEEEQEEEEAYEEEEEEEEDMEVGGGEEEEEDEDQEGEDDSTSAPISTMVTARVEHARVGRARRASAPAMTTPTFTYKPSPSEWSVEEVSAFIHTLPGCRDVAEAFRLQEIDGQALLLLTEDHLMTSMNIKLGPALKICAHINALKNQ
uniref:Polyhomeotic-like protein 3 n=1 Tax=Cynoglossus semilaevis TaxID=244447 RepID=A0A3P8WCH6_CYNSE